MLPPTQIFLPFGSGHVVEIILNCNPDGTLDRPIRVYPLSEVGEDLVRSGDCAGEIAWRTARANGHIKEGKKHSIGVQLQGLSKTASIAGESGGLPLALAMYCELAGIRGQKIAATGCLGSIRDGEVTKVEGIEQKMLGVLEQLDSGAKVFIPRGNESDVSREILEKFQQKSIELCFVNAVTDAVKDLDPKVLSENTSTARQRKQSLMRFVASWSISLVAIVIGIALWVIFIQPTVFPGAELKMNVASGPVSGQNDGIAPRREVTENSFPGQHAKVDLSDTIDQAKREQPKKIDNDIGGRTSSSQSNNPGFD